MVELTPVLLYCCEDKIERNMQLIDPIFWTHGKECRTMISTKIRASEVVCKYIMKEREHKVSNLKVIH